MRKLRKIGKKVWKGIKKLGKKIGKGFKKVFAGVSKFLGKLGPIGTIGMMIAMPWLGSYVWSGFSSWAGGLSGTFGKRQINLEEDSLVYKNRTVKDVKTEYLNEYSSDFGIIYSHNYENKYTTH